MKSGVKYAGLAVVLIILMVCNTTKHSSLGILNSQQIDSLPAIIIQSKTAASDPFLLNDITSSYLPNNPKFLSSNIKIIKSETVNYDPDRDFFFNFQELPHIDFGDLKLAVDDYGNINYLNQDF